MKILNRPPSGLCLRTIELETDPFVVIAFYFPFLLHFSYSVASRSRLGWLTVNFLAQVKDILIESCLSFSYRALFSDRGIT